MNLLELYRQSQFAKIFNSPNVKGTITVDGYSFDARVVDGELYCNGLPVEHFLEEAMLTVDEKLSYEEAILNWLLTFRAA